MPGTRTGTEASYEIRIAEAEPVEEPVGPHRGRATRMVKRALIPGYGRKGMGWLHPRRKLYNGMYNRTTFSIWNLFR